MDFTGIGGYASGLYDFLSYHARPLSIVAE
jgi:hypothetical protein